MGIFLEGISQASVTNNAQNKLAALRNALQNCEEFNQWLIGYATGDLVSLGFSTASSTAIFSAFADAHALYQIYTTGQPPGTYPQATSAYTYASSQRVIVGPLS